MRIRLFVLSCLCILLFVHPAHAWQNSPFEGGASTDNPSKCNNPPYATHDWIADHALAPLQDDEKEWLLPHKTMYLLATEALDNKKIPTECNGPHTGYKDKHKGHCAEWKSDFSGFKEGKNRTAIRAQEEYNKAIIAYEREEFNSAAFFLGAMAIAINLEKSYE